MGTETWFVFEWKNKVFAAVEFSDIWFQNSLFLIRNCFNGGEFVALYFHHRPAILLDLVLRTRYLNYPLVEKKSHDIKAILFKEVRLFI